MDNSVRTEIYRIVDLESEEERETAIEELVNTYETAVSQRDDLQVQADRLRADLETSRKTEEIYRDRLDKILGSEGEEIQEQEEKVEIWEEIE